MAKMGEKSCVANYFLSFSPVLMKFGTETPWGVVVQDTFFDSGRKSVAMVMAYYGKNGGKILRRELLPQFFTNSHEIWHRCLRWGVDVQDTIFLTVAESVLPW